MKNDLNYEILEFHIREAAGEPHYLDAAVIMDDGYGAREYGWLRNALASVNLRMAV